MFFKYLREPTLTDLMPSRDAYKYLEYGMTALGWMPQAVNARYRFLYRIWTIFVITLAGYLPIGLSITYVKEFSTFTPGELFTSLQAGINAPGAFTRGMISFLNVWRLAELKQLFDEMDKRCVKDEERIAVHRGVKRCNSLYLLYQFTYTIFVTITYLTSVVRGLTPWRLYNCFVDWRDGTSSLLIASFIEYLFMSSGVYFNQMTDVYPLIFGFSLRMHLELLCKRIENLRTDPSMSEEQNYLELRGCISDHKLIIKICNLMRPYISRTTFVQFLFVGLLFGLTMINLMFFVDLWTGIASVAYVIALFFQTFPFCFTCNLIESDCESLALAIFQSHWVDATRRYKSALIYFLQNVQQSISFTAGSIFPISLNTNIKVAKLAFSVVTFVKQMNIADKLKAD
ncbi:odorant receptor 42b-like [Drosophila novamexicana]|uniref:odorant receptor 42b-like n=1 Tax=Drosophila novamexicana TaxID=47314 RepID=UPI0011E5CD1D|nr:odorant receptor 42b-like [Drosophila novamexicana]